LNELFSHTPKSIYPPLVDEVVVLTGSTASGKSAAALEIAQRIGGEILSLDALAVYRGMDIGTAKPDTAAQERVRHHMIDLVDPDQEFSVAQYLARSHALVAEIRSRGAVPIFVGGTPMYLKAILRGFDPGPPADIEFRQAVERDVKEFGSEQLHQRLMQVDPLSAHRVDPTDVRRMIRALEVARATGHPISHQQTQFDRPKSATARVFALRWNRSQLHNRINQRVDAMFKEGLVDEVLSLRQRFGTFSKTAGQAVGYREVIEMLEEASDGAPERLGRCQEEVAAHTRQLARRQETWFRSFQEIKFIEIEDQTSITRFVDEKFGKGLNR
jgi:tRNA dimethylallyltransferase